MRQMVRELRTVCHFQPDFTVTDIPYASTSHPSQESLHHADHDCPFTSVELANRTGHRTPAETDAAHQAT